MRWTPMQIKRLTRGLSQEQASELLGISRGYLSTLETCASKPTPELLIKIAKLYECSVRELFSGTS